MEEVGDDEADVDADFPVEEDEPQSDEGPKHAWTSTPLEGVDEEDDHDD